MKDKQLLASLLKALQEANEIAKDTQMENCDSEALRMTKQLIELQKKHGCLSIMVKQK